MDSLCGYLDGVMAIASMDAIDDFILIALQPFAPTLVMFVYGFFFVLSPVLRSFQSNFSIQMSYHFQKSKEN